MSLDDSNDTIGRGAPSVANNPQGHSKVDRSKAVAVKAVVVVVDLTAPVMRAVTEVTWLSQYMLFLSVERSGSRSVSK